MLQYAHFSFIFLQHSTTFDVSHVFLPLTIAELSTLKQVRFYWPTLYSAHWKTHTPMMSPVRRTVKRH